MMENLFWGGYAIPGAQAAWYYSLIPVITIWSLVWKAWALWIAARKGQKVWYFFLLIINLLGILEILYIFVFSKKDMSKPETMESPRSKVKEEPKKETPVMPEPQKMPNPSEEKEPAMSQEMKVEPDSMEKISPKNPSESKMDMEQNNDGVSSKEEEKKEEM